MKQEKFLPNFSKSLVITLLIGILLLSIILLSTKYIEKRENISKNHQNKINEIKNQIEWIKYAKEYRENDKFTTSFLIYTKNIESAENIKKVIENSNILQNASFTVQLQNDPTNTRGNLLTFTFDSDDKYNPKFEKIIKKLMNSEYIDKEYQKLSKTGPKLSFKELNGKNLSEKESNLLEKFRKYQLSEDKSSAQLHKQIKFDAFAEFILICQKNQKPEKKLDGITSNPIDTIKQNV